MVNMSPISFYLELKVEQNQESQTIKFSPPVYINKVFNKFYLNKSNTINISMKKTTLL